MVNGIRIALAFLTILPVAPAGDLSGKDLTASAAFFPLAGWVIGGLLAAAAWLAKAIGIPALVTAVLLVGLAALLTRGLHLDGVADVLDGLGGAFEPEKRLAIMKDSAIGTFGVTGLVLLLMLKVGSLAQILASTAAEKYFFIASVPAAARWTMITLAYKSRYPRSVGTGHAFVGKIRWSQVAAGMATLLPVLLFGVSGVALLVSVQITGLMFRTVANTAFGGVTGDVLGACCEWGEAAGWLLLLACIG